MTRANTESIDASIQAESVTKTYVGPDGISRGCIGVSMLALPGDLVVIRGGGSSGKSTLLKLLWGSTIPTHGHVRMLGQNSRQRRGISNLWLNQMSLISDPRDTLPLLTVSENIELALRIQRIPSDERRALTLSSLDAVGLAKQANQLPTELSGGQLQRVITARAVARRPQVIIADEPTSQLDRANADKVFSLFARMCRESGVMVVVAVHESTVVNETHRVIRLKDGRVV